MSRWPSHSWSVRIGTPAAAIWVPKVWRRSWKRSGRTPATRSASLNRARTLEESSGPPVWGGKTPGRHRPGSCSLGSDARAPAHPVVHRHRAAGALGLRASELRLASGPLPGVGAPDPDPHRGPVHVPPAKREYSPCRRPVSAAVRYRRGRWGQGDRPGHHGVGPRPPPRENRMSASVSSASGSGHP